MGLKSNGQQHNKLGLTLSLGRSDHTCDCPQLEGDNALSKKQGNVSTIIREKEAYAIMNPDGSLFCSFKTGSENEFSKESTKKL